MRIRLLLYASVAALLGMATFSAFGGEKLAKEDGEVSAIKLPLDAQTAKVKFETATFGLG